MRTVERIELPSTRAATTRTRSSCREPIHTDPVCLSEQALSGRSFLLNDPQPTDRSHGEVVDKILSAALEHARERFFRMPEAPCVQLDRLTNQQGIFWWQRIRFR